MSKGATLVEVIYIDTEEHVPVLVGIGDTIVATEWAERSTRSRRSPTLKPASSRPRPSSASKEYRQDAVARIDVKREDRSGLYACYLGAQRGKLRGTELGWVEWLSAGDDPAGRARPAPAEESAAGGIRRAIERQLARVALDSMQPVGHLCDLLGISAASSRRLRTPWSTCSTTRAGRATPRPSATPGSTPAPCG